MKDLVKTKELTTKEAFNLDQEIKNLRKSNIVEHWRMIHFLGRMREGRGWIMLGYDSWPQYLAQPEIAMAEKTFENNVSKYLKIYKYIKSSPNGEKLNKFDIVMSDPLSLEIDDGRIRLMMPVINDDNADKLLEMAMALSYSDFEEEINLLKPQPESLTPADGKFNMIVIDPPWPYGTEYDPEVRRVANPYGETSIEELEKFVLPADDDCALFLWTTHKFIFDALRLLKIWGFEYKITMVWDKQKMGMGAWLRCQSEFCLLGIKGHPPWALTNQRDILSVARKEHSRKPDEFYSMVEKLCPVEKKIDIFSREKREGWDQYGNEKNKF